LGDIRCLAQTRNFRLVMPRNRIAKIDELLLKIIENSPGSTALTIAVLAELCGVCCEGTTHKRLKTFTIEGKIYRKKFGPRAGSVHGEWPYRYWIVDAAPKRHDST